MICSTTHRTFYHTGSTTHRAFYLPNKKENDRDYLITKSFRALQNGEQQYAF